MVCPVALRKTRTRGYGDATNGDAVASSPYYTVIVAMSRHDLKGRTNIIANAAKPPLFLLELVSSPPLLVMLLPPGRVTPGVSLPPCFFPSVFRLFLPFNSQLYAL
jgi:hypothetical protein